MFKSLFLLTVLVLISFTVDAQHHDGNIQHAHGDMGSAHGALRDGEMMDYQTGEAMKRPMEIRPKFDEEHRPNRQEFNAPPYEGPPKPWMERELKHRGMPMMGGEQDMRMPPPRPPMTPEEEQMHRHMQQGHREGRKFHKKMGCMFIATAIVFTLFGVCLGKCCRRCHKKRQEKLQNYIRRSVRTSDQLSEEIQVEEQKLAEMKILYNNRRMMEDQSNQMMMRQAQGIQISNPQVYYGVAPNNVYNAYPSPTVAVGRPLNQSANSSFANQYPQI